MLDITIFGKMVVRGLAVLAAALGGMLLWASSAVAGDPAAAAAGQGGFWWPLAQGFGMGAGLIIAIGAQNAFVFTRGVRRNHHITVATICLVCDVACIAMGVLGVGALVAAHPEVSRWAAWGGAAFLGWYGWLSFRAAFQGGSLEAGNNANMPLRAAVTYTLAVTLLNPHVYLDTVVLLGSISGHFEGTGRYFFGLGAILASTAWFYALALGGRALAPLFKRPTAWRVLDAAVCLTMWSIAVNLVRMAVA